MKNETIVDIPEEEKHTTENDYLELAEDCKNRIEMKDKELKVWIKKYMRFKKRIAIIFGTVMRLEEYLERVSPDVAYDPIAEHLISSVINDCNDYLFREEEDKLDVGGITVIDILI